MKPNSFWRNTIKNGKPSYLKRAAPFRGFHRFADGASAFGPSGKILGVLKKTNIQDLTLFPDLHCLELKKQISKKFRINPLMVTVGNGSDEIIENIPHVFLTPKDKILVILPTFFRFIESSQKKKAKIITVTTSDADDFAFTDKIINKIIVKIRKHQPKIIWLCTPNNPTGKIMSRKQIEKILKASHGLVVVDEIYQEFIDPENKKSTIKLLAKHKNLLVIKSLSKVFGLAGIRFGFGLAPPEIIWPLEKWRLRFNLNTITQKLALAALKDTHHLKRVAKQTARQREKLFAAIKKMPHLQLGAESQTNLFLLKHQRKNLLKELLKRKILVADFNNCPGIEGQGFVRIKVHNQKENRFLLKALKAIK